MIYDYCLLLVLPQARIQAVLYVQIYTFFTNLQLIQKLQLRVTTLDSYIFTVKYEPRGLILVNLVYTGLKLRGRTSNQLRNFHLRGDRSP